MQNDSCPVIQAELQAKELESKGKFSEAMRVWLDSVGQTGDSAIAWTESVRLALLANDRNLANTLGLLGLQKARKHFSVWEAWANIPAHNKNWAEAAERWDVVLKELPDDPRAWLGAAWIYLQNGKPAEAENHIMASLRKGKPTSRAYMMLIDIHAKNQEIVNSFITTALRLFPGESYLYHHIFESLVRVGKLDKAEAVLLEGAVQFPHDADLFADHAELAFLRKDYKTALARYQEMQKTFPVSQRALAGGIKAALELKDYNTAVPLWDEYQTHSFQPLELAAGYEKAFLEILKKDAELNDNRRFSSLIGLLEATGSRNPYGYEVKANFYLQRRDHARAISACLEAFNKNLDSEKLSLTLARAHALAGNTRLTLLITRSMVLNASKRTFEVLEAIRVLFELRMYEEARKLGEDLIERFGTDSKTLDLLFRNEYASNPERLGDLIEKFVPLYNSLPDALAINSDSFKRLMNLMWTDGQIGSEYDNAHSLLMARSLKSLKKGSQVSSQKKTVCFCLMPELVNYFAPVIKLFPPDSLDLVFNGKSPAALKRIEEGGLTNYNILFNSSAVNDYKYSIVDTWYLISKDFVPKNIIIGVAHEAAQYFATHWFRVVDSMIYSSQAYATWDYIRLKKGEHEYLTECDVKAKCEFAYSGLFHLEDWLGRDKAALKRELAETYNFDIPDDRPLVFFLEDEVCEWNQIVRCANMLSESCTVFLKPCRMHLKEQSQRKLASSVYCFKDWNLSNNLLRFSADFILASFFSGTLLTSIMLGLPVVPFYTKYVGKAKWFSRALRPKHYLSLMPQSTQFNNVITPFPTDVALSLLSLNDMFYDLISPERIASAISGDEYMRKYNSLLPILQRATFGDYEIKGSTRKTYRLLQNFVKNSSFGEDCVAVYFK